MDASGNWRGCRVRDSMGSRGVEGQRDSGSDRVLGSVAVTAILGTVGRNDAALERIVGTLIGHPLFTWNHL
ncbi:hypothetical protein PHAMO_260009 [Magnetospirillum molischianum DSM 120]|uniref:Uncharacterized protein n=1 Tax=Magnetospirillum molischianum DSM 120 TaxID=1150626 RepID=H8FS04_MAGML|nr:hypothetical protein PHAMO_260009 [Magnetospirillum molischianum DSM 120]